MFSYHTQRMRHADVNTFCCLCSALPQPDFNLTLLDSDPLSMLDANARHILSVQEAIRLSFLSRSQG